MCCPALPTVQPAFEFFEFSASFLRGFPEGQIATPVDGVRSLQSTFKGRFNVLFGLGFSRHHMNASPVIHE